MRWEPVDLMDVLEEIVGDLDEFLKSSSSPLPWFCNPRPRGNRVTPRPKIRKMEA